MTLQRLVLNFRTGEVVVRCLYRTEGEAGSNTKACCRACPLLSLLPPRYKVGARRGRSTDHEGTGIA
jgi:hypothetical protein